MANAKKKKLNRNPFSGMDLTLLVIVFFLLAFGLIMIYSASSYEAMLKFNDSSYYLSKQLKATVVAIVVMVPVAIINYHVWAKLAYPAFAVSIVMVFLVRTSLGIEANGARRWINVAGTSLQPAEAAKIAIIMLTSFLIVKTGREAINTLSGALKVILPGALMGVLVWKITNNMSSGAIIALIPFALLFVSTKNYKWYVLMLASAAAAIAGGIYLIINSSGAASFRTERVRAWLNPEAYSSGKAFQTLQALYSIGSGGVFGKGLGQSMQKLGSLPEAQNDMIFSIICEELGMFGAGAVIFLFIILIWRCVVVAQNAPDLYGSLLVVGVMSHIALQVILNIAVVTNTIPNTGITLPFISYGGSSIVFTMIEVGIVLNVSHNIVLE